MYELYGKIYDENPPKYIKVYDEDWYWNDYDGYVTKESLKTTPDAQIYLMDRYRTFMNLDKEVEIIEEPKKIEKLLMNMNSKSKGAMTADYKEFEINDIVEHNFDVIHKKNNEIIDEINSLKEK